MISFFTGLFTSTVSVLSGWKGYAAALAFGLLLGGTGTWRVMSWHEAANQTAAVVKTLKVVKAQDVITFNVGDAFEKVRIADQTDLQLHLQEVVLHVTPQIDNTFPVPLGFVRVFNTAWHGPVPDAATGADDAPADTPISAVAETEVVNAGDYDRVSHQLTALQDWIRQQQSLSEKSQ